MLFQVFCSFAALIRNLTAILQFSSCISIQNNLQKQHLYSEKANAA